MIRGYNNSQEKGGELSQARRITDPEEARKYFKVRNPKYEEKIIKMVAESGALFEGHFVEDGEQD